MASWLSIAVDHLWSNAIAAIPLIVVVAAVSKWARCRPATRHGLWLMVLVWLVCPPLLPGLINTDGLGRGAETGFDRPVDEESKHLADSGAEPVQDEPEVELADLEVRESGRDGGVAEPDVSVRVTITAVESSPPSPKPEIMPEGAVETEALVRVVDAEPPRSDPVAAAPESNERPAPRVLHCPSNQLTHEDLAGLRGSVAGRASPIAAGTQPGPSAPIAHPHASLEETDDAGSVPAAPFGPSRYSVWLSWISHGLVAWIGSLWIQVEAVIGAISELPRIPVSVWVGGLLIAASMVSGSKNMAPGWSGWWV